MTGIPSVHVGTFLADKTVLTDLMRIRAPYSELPWAEQAVPQLQREWKLHAVAQDSNTGYDGALFSTEINGKPHFFFFHQGTNHYRDVPSLGRIVTGKEPQQAADARRFVEQGKALIAQRYPGQDLPTIQVGFSLGGPLASLCAAPDEPIITYESPGPKEILEAKGIDPKSVSPRLLEILSPHANFINSFGTHIGTVIEAGPKFWEPKRVSTLDFIANSVRSHRRQRLCDGLESMDDFNARPAEAVGRPNQIWDAFREYIADYIGEKPDLGERALASTAQVIDAMQLDEKFIHAVGNGANALLSYMSDLYTRFREKEKPMRVRTHPAVERDLVKQVDVSPSTFQARVRESRTMAEGRSSAV